MRLKVGNPFTIKFPAVTRKRLKKQARNLSVSESVIIRAGTDDKLLQLEKGEPLVISKQPEEA
jgi:hypothetical protein